MKISAPLPSSGKVRQYQGVAGAAANIPRHSEWMAKTKDGGPRGVLITRIDDCLKLYGDPKADGWDRLSLLGELYFCTNSYLKRAPGAPPKPRESSVNDLFLTVVDQLCRAFNCTVNFLPQMLEECWGRVLTEHGHAVDTQIVPVGAMPTVAKYLDRAAAECYRISFRSGLAYVRALPNFYSWVLANSSAVGWTDGRGKKAPQMMFPGYAGFALSMDRRMYMAHHRGSFNQDNFFHSSYLSGDAVLCTGTILIENGVVKAIANDSGHYQPTLEHLVNVIRTLQMHGANISKLEVYAAPYSWRDNTGTVQKQWGSFWATDVLTTRGSGGALYQRMQANQNNIKSRGGSPQSPVVTLPTRQLPPPPPPRF